MTHPLRRQDRAITDAARIEEIIASARYATVALVDGDEPYVVTLSCGYDAPRRRLCFHVAHEGRKLDIVARNPRACATIVVDHGYSVGACEHPFESVVMTGRMRVLDDPDDAREAMRTLIVQLEGTENLPAVWDRNKLDGEAVFRRMRMLVLEIDDVTAKAGK